VHSPGGQTSNEPPSITPPGGEDAALVAAVLRKDRKAAAEFVTRYADDVYKYLRSRLAPRYNEVDDLVQEVFLAAWANLGKFRADGSLQAWLIGIARHKVEDYYRERLRVPESIEGTEDLDAAISNDNRFLYVLTPGTSNIQGFTISTNGSLTPINQISGIPSSAGGLVVR